MRSHVERVVAGVDFGEPSVAAAAWAATQLAPGAQLVLVHVLDAGEPRWIGGRSPRGTVLQLARDAAEQRLRELTRTLGASLAFTEVVVGQPATRIAEIADEYQADVIVIGPHGGRPPRWSLLGSTAERLVRAAAVPIVIVQEPRPRPPRKILVPVQELDLPRPIRRWIGIIRRGGDAEVTVLTVVPQTATWPRAGTPLSARSRRTSVPAVALRQRFARWADSARRGLGLDEESFTARVEFGSPAERIVEFARLDGTDLIAIPTQGAGAVRRAVLGSVTASVIRGAPCPVLVVPRAAARRRSRKPARRPRSRAGQLHEEARSG